MWASPAKTCNHVYACSSELFDSLDRSTFGKTKISKRKLNSFRPCADRKLTRTKRQPLQALRPAFKHGVL